MSQGRILVVEDDFDIANMLRIYFQSQGYEVLVAARGGEGLELCRQKLPHVIVLDIMLPDMDGYDVCRELRGTLRTSHIPIIFLTQKDERSDKIHGLELGADDYITKPFDVEELKLRIKNVIARTTYESLTSPTTGLPSGRLIEEHLRQLMRTDDWRVIYVGVDGIDAFNETYGFVAGEEVLRFAAMVMGETVDELGTPNDFIGHVGGDDFIIITRSANTGAMVEDLARRFDRGVGTHYPFKDRDKVEMMSLAWGVVTPEDGPFTDIREITEEAARARREGVRS